MREVAMHTPQAASGQSLFFTAHFSSLRFALPQSDTSDPIALLPNA